MTTRGTVKKRNAARRRKMRTFVRHSRIMRFNWVVDSFNSSEFQRAAVERCISFSCDYETYGLRLYGSSGPKCQPRKPSWITETLKFDTLVFDSEAFAQLRKDRWTFVSSLPKGMKGARYLWAVATFRGYLPHLFPGSNG